MTPQRRAAVLAVVLASVAPAQVTPSVTLVLHGTAAEGSVEFGKPFELDVVRHWVETGTPEPWSSTLLAPLVVEELDVVVGTSADTTTETRRLRARVFQRGAVTLLPRTEATRTLLVDSCLPGDDAGSLEQPELAPLGVRPARRALVAACVAGSIALVLAFAVQGFVLAVRRRRSRVPVRVRLAREVDALVAEVPADIATARAQAIAATRVLREVERHARAAGIRLEVDAVEELDRQLGAVKFAGCTLHDDERLRLLATLRRAVETLPEGAP